MAIKRYYAEADNTITNAYNNTLTARGTGSNTGANDILETFSIYGQYTTSSSELSRVLIKFPVTGTTSIKTDRTAGSIPAAAASSLKFYLRLFNARHDEQLPENLTLSIFPIARDWEEGTGLDLVNHTDKTKDAIPGSNWDNRTKGVAWLRNGGDFHSGSHDSTYAASFVTGSEDLEVDVTTLVEEWLGSTVHATGSITVSDTAVANIGEGDTIQLISSAGKVVTLTLQGQSGATTSAETSGSTLTAKTLAPGSYANAALHATAQADEIMRAINYHTEFTATKSSNVVTVIQAVTGKGGNTAITITELGATGLSKADFVNGAGYTNYGFGIMVTSSQEAYFSSSIGDSGSEVQNTAGITKSMYTKRFFARSSEFFFRRPVIEARWEDRKTDDRNKFYASSSAIADNANNLYLYNYVNGTLANFPTDDTGAVTVNLYASSGSAPTGSTLTDATTTRVSTGIYKAALTLATTESVLHDVWFLPGTVAGFHTGTINVRTRSFKDTNTQSQYVTTITNLKDSYSRKDTERMRVFARERNFTPTVYTVSNAAIEGTTVVSASYSIVRTIDNKVLFPHSTGSAPFYTYLSYDASGSYFDLDMSLLEAGYMYGIKMAYYVGGVWREQEEVFKFRVEE